ncbi:MAG: hypothetical protein IJW82_02230 [Clostridia bacterium]|nr:hypothetical protein [Clostridia bacterium]
MATATKKENKKVYDFGEKKEENINGKKVPVEFHTPKYKEAKNKAIELLESDKYKGILEASDFWILVNTYSNKSKAMYSGLIISHDGCLKINDTLEEKLKFRPECMSIDKDGYNNSLVFTYICSEQGIYEVGEVSKDNCKNDYPYAMALKRCMDRVILKNSKIAYSGIYSDSEADEFTQRIEKNENTEEVKTETKKTTKESTKETTKAKKKSELMIQDTQVEIIKKLYTAEELMPLMKHIGKVKITELTLLEASSLIKRKENQAKEEKPVENQQADDNYLE